MNAEVSRALGTFVAANGLGREAARELAKQFASADRLEDLPDWVKEFGDSDLERRARRIAR